MNTRHRIKYFAADPLPMIFPYGVHTLSQKSQLPLVWRYHYREHVRCFIKHTGHRSCQEYTILLNFRCQWRNRAVEIWKFNCTSFIGWANRCPIQLIRTPTHNCAGTQQVTVDTNDVYRADTIQLSSQRYEYHRHYPTNAR